MARVCPACVCNVRPAKSVDLCGSSVVCLTSDPGGPEFMNLYSVPSAVFEGCILSVSCSVPAPCVPPSFYAFLPGQCVGPCV